MAASGQQVSAGIYNPRESSLWPPGTYIWPLPNSSNVFRFALGDLRGLPVARSISDHKVSVHQRYWSRIAQLEADDQVGALNSSERVELGACYLRLRKTEEARRILEQALRDEPHNFMVLANVAAVYELTGEWDRATTYLEEALKVWPDMEPGYDDDQLRFYRRAERFHLLLLKQRILESRNKPIPEQLTVDPLFPGWESARDGADYAPGSTQAKLAAELPGDAISIVEQLVLWSPHEDRLYWLLGELLNTRGDVKSAAVVLDELVYARGYKPELLLQHRRVLLNAAQVLGALEGNIGRSARDQLLWTFMPRGSPVPIGMAALVQEGIWPAIIAEHTRETSLEPVAGNESQQPSTKEQESTNNKNASANWLTDPRALGVGFAAGVLVTLLAGLQLREIRRRRELRAGAPQTGAG